MSDARDLLERVIAPDVVDAILELIDERVAQHREAIEQQSNGKDWYTIEEAAERESCSPDALRMRIKRRPERYEVRQRGRRVDVSAKSIDGDERSSRGRLQ